MSASVIATCPAILRHRPLVQEVRAAEPDEKVDGRANQEERHVQVDLLVLQDLVGGDRVGPRPDVELRQHDRDREEQHQRSTESDGSPASKMRRGTRPHCSAGHVLQHQQRQRSERQAKAQREADQPRRQELRPDRGTRRSLRAPDAAMPTTRPRCCRRSSSADAVGGSYVCISA